MTPNLDPKTHGFMLREYQVPDAVAHSLTPDPEHGWLVTKISAFAGAVPAVVRVLPIAGGSGGALGVVNLEAGGCYVIHPGGAYRNPVEVSGLGMKVIVEYWFPIRAGNPSLVGVVIT